MCTKVQLTTIEGNTIVGRTGEFEAYCQTEVLFLPSGSCIDRFAGTDKYGTFNNKYALIGTITPFLSKETLLDGMNEKGLVFNTNWYSQKTEYKVFDESDSDKVIDFVVLPSYILSECSTIEEAKAWIEKNREWIGVLKTVTNHPYHHSLTDAKGGTIVLCMEKGELLVLDNNKYKVLTNTPELKVQIENADNIINNTINIDPLTNERFGMNYTSNVSTINLPGGFDSMSRFTRAAYISKNIDPVSGDDEGVNTIFRILNTSDSIKGMMLTDESKNDVSQYPSNMIWSTQHDKHSAYQTDVFIVSDTKNLRYFHKTYDNLTPRFIDMKECIKANKKITVKRSNDGISKFQKINI